MVATLLQMGDPGAEESAAEQLWQTAEKNRLSDAEARQATELLDHRNPFTRAIAEWSLALKVGLFRIRGARAMGPTAWILGLRRVSVA